MQEGFQPQQDQILNGQPHRKLTISSSILVILELRVERF